MSRTTNVQPRPHQVSALTSLTTSLAVHDRTQLVMACGTGKTLVGRWHAQASDADSVLVLLPSLALVAQTLREWRRATGNVATGWRFRALVVCSDPTTTAGYAERTGDAGEDEVDIDNATWDQVDARVTTDPQLAARFLREQQPGRPQVVFSTYHSSPVVAAAQKANRGDVGPFDLVVCDEAHRLAGRPSKAFTTVLDADAIAARKRLFMTATPKAFRPPDGADEGISMDDHTLFGPVAHTVSFGEAIAAGLLCDYQVLVVSEKADAPTADPARTVPAALVKAVDRHGLRRILSFHGRVAKAASFASHVDGRHSEAGTVVRAQHVSGAMNTAERIRILEWLGGSGPEVRVVSNARCLSEGVDVPAVDGVLFADSRTSIIDIIQAIGRVLRPSPNKAIGTIVLPVILPSDGDDDTALSLSAFEHVWTVLRGLRAHDQRLAEELDDASRRWARADGTDEPWHWRVKTAQAGGFRIPRLEFVFPEGIEGRKLLADMELRTVQAVGSMWEENYGLLQSWAERHDGKLIPTSASVEGVRLGQWVLNQRLLHRRDALDPERARLLEQIPGWAWDPKDARWWATLDLVKDYAAGRIDGRLGLADNQTGKPRFDDVYTRETPRIWLGVWMARQRQTHRMQMLPPDRVAGLEAIAGWTWDGGLPAGDIEMVEALREFVEFEKHANVPEGHVDGDLRLGAWCWAVRRRRLTDRLAPALYDEILAATPSKDLTDERFPWHFDETRWRLGYFALRQFTAREGLASVRGTHREQLPDADYGLGQWCANQRLKYRRGELDPRYTDLLQALPGWQWEIDLQRVEAQEPVDLPPTSEHGGPGAYSNHGCRCAECLEWRRASDVDRLAEKRKLKDPVPAGPFRRRVEEIEAALDTESNDGARNGRMLISAVSRVSIGVIRAVMKGDRDQVERDHETRMLATSIEDCLSARNQEGSRGRVTSQLLGLVDSAPTFALLDDLKSRGFGLSWVSRELEYAGGLQFKRHARIRGHLARRIAELHELVGDLAMPTLPVTTRKPTLVELRADLEEKAS